MLNIRFGRHVDFGRTIAEQLDRTRFTAEFGSLDCVDFHKFDCIVPFELDENETLEKNKTFYGLKYWSTNQDIVRLCHDKLALNRWLLESKFAELVPGLLEKDCGQFPYIVKKRQDECGVHSHLVRNLEDEVVMAPLLQSPEYFRQAYISGSEEFALHLLIVNRQAVYSQTVKYEMGRNLYVKGRNMTEVTRTLLPDSEHLETFVPVLVSLGYNGTCCINYKMDNGLPKLLEINPRLGFSLCWDINRYLEAYLGSLGCARQS